MCFSSKRARTPPSIPRSRSLPRISRPNTFAGSSTRSYARSLSRQTSCAGATPPTSFFPDWLLANWRRTYGEERAAAIVRAHIGEPRLDITLKPDLDPVPWAERLNATVLPTGSLRLTEHARIPDLPGFAEGAWWVQDAAASVPARLLGDVRGRRVLDLCAAPGGKTALLAALGAEVTAVDRAPERLARLRENLARLNLMADVIEADVRDFAAPEPFDAILLDAPCTATGTIRRHPDLPWIKEADDIRSLSLLQGELLERAFSLLRPSGRLVYSVCSLEPEEGEETVAAFLSREPAAERVAAGNGEIPGADEFVTALGEVRTTPADWPQFGGLDGFYAVRLTRR